MSEPGDVQHEMLLLALKDRLYTSPTIPPKATILDVGTGTGTWACQVATRHPDSRVYGIDLHQVSPATIPPNAIFETVNVMTGFPFNTGTFDFVHSRLLVGGITNWRLYLQNLLRITKRGGYVECVEMELCPCYSGTPHHDNVDSWTSVMAKILLASQLTPDIADNLESLVQQAGFIEVQHTTIETPIGSWSEDAQRHTIGQLALEFTQVHLVQWVSAALLADGMAAEEVKDRAQKFMQELSDPTSKAFFRWHFVTGKKSE